MRTIKFRGKVEYPQKYFGKNDIPNGKFIVGELHLNCRFPHIHTDKINKYPIDPNTIGQFTGLHDSIGREIYEGDIIKSSHGTLHYIVYDNDLACFKAVVARYNPLGEYETLSKGWVVQFNKEVIGNIHDNPELLKGK